MDIQVREYRESDIKEMWLEISSREKRRQRLSRQAIWAVLWDPRR